MVEILWHRLETRRQTEKTNVNLYIGRNRSTRLKQTPVIPEEKKNELRYEVPFVFGNLEFPEDVDFAFPRKVASTGSEQFEMARTFRYKGIFDTAWSGDLSYEFNYRLVGLTVR